MRVRENIRDSYSIRHCVRMNAYREGLWAHPEMVTELSTDTAQEVISYLLELACQATNYAPIMIGRRALCAIPRRWLLDRIEGVANETLDMEDCWEYRRLLELYCCLDHTLARTLASSGLSSQDLEIEEAAQDYLAAPEWFEETVCKYLDEPLP